MGEYNEIIEEYEDYSIKQYNRLNSLDRKIRIKIIELESTLSLYQSKKFAELVYELKEYKYLFCEDIIKFMLQKDDEENRS